MSKLEAEGAPNWFSQFMLGASKPLHSKVFKMLMNSGLAYTLKSTAMPNATDT